MSRGFSSRIVWAVVRECEVDPNSSWPGGKGKKPQIESFPGQPNFSSGKEVKEVFREELEGVGAC